MVDVAQKLSKGTMNAKADTRAPGELGKLAGAMNELSAKLSANMYQLILERNRLQQLIDNLSEGVLALDAKGEITHRNPALNNLLCGGQNISDMRLRRLADECVWSDFKSVIETCKQTERIISVGDSKLKVVISPLKDDTGNAAGAVGLFSDVTKAEILERTRRDYVANLSHEMRTPLTGIRALVEPLKDGLVKDEKMRMIYYDKILNEIMRMSRLIKDLLELSHMQSGTFAVKKESMKLDEILKDVCERYSLVAAEHNLSFKVGSNFSTLPQVYTNADRVEQLLLLLLDNAIKYTPNGGITVSTEFDEKKVTITVADTGIGIEKSNLDLIFDRFYKEDEAHSGNGAGIGLSIAQELCKWMGESIWVESEKGKGSKFHFTVSRDPM